MPKLTSVRFQTNCATSSWGWWTSTSPFWDGTLGLIQSKVHRIHLKPGAAPARQMPNKAGHRHRKMEEERVKEMRRLEVIEPAVGEWASPVVIVPKPEGTPRFCSDCRRLNLVTVEDAYPIPRMDDCLGSQGDAQVFSILDCNARYWEIPIAPEDKHITTFTSHTGTWKCVRLPFGLCSAPATFNERWISSWRV